MAAVLLFMAAVLLFMAVLLLRMAAALTFLAAFRQDEEYSVLEVDFHHPWYAPNQTQNNAFSVHARPIRISLAHARTWRSAGGTSYTDPVWYGPAIPLHGRYAMSGFGFVFPVRDRDSTTAASRVLRHSGTAYATCLRPYPVLKHDMRGTTRSTCSYFWSGGLYSRLCPYGSTSTAQERIVLCLFVLPERIVLCACYAKSRTDRAYGLPAHVPLQWLHPLQALIMLAGFRWGRISPPSLRLFNFYYVMLYYIICYYVFERGLTWVGYAAMAGERYTPEIAVFGGAWSTGYTVDSAINLRACYAMPGTDIAYGAVGLCACYAMSGTDMAYANSAIRLRARFAVPGTDTAKLNYLLLHSVCPVLEHFFMSEQSAVVVFDKNHLYGGLIFEVLCTRASVGPTHTGLGETRCAVWSEAWGGTD
eukprot:571429-Rhodomonas_salina.1